MDKPKKPTDDTGHYDGSRGDWTSYAMSPGWGPSAGVRKIRTRRESGGQDGEDVQWIKSAQAMDNVGKGVLPDRLSRGSINSDWSNTGRLSVDDRKNVKHSVEPGAPGANRGFREEALRAKKPQPPQSSFAAHITAHVVAGSDEGSDED